MKLQYLWKHLSGKSRWFYILPWIIVTAVTWASYSLIEAKYHTQLADLGVLGALLEISFASILVGFFQGFLLRLYLPRFPIYLWILACVFWFSLTSQVIPTLPYHLQAPFSSRLGLPPFSLEYLSFFIFPLLSWYVLSKYSLNNRRWLVFSFLVFLYVIAASSPGTLADWFIPDIAVLFDRQYGPVESRYPFSGINIGIATSLIFVINPKIPTD